MKFLATAALLATVVSPVQEGAYWRVETVFSMTHPRQVGSGYWVTERRLSTTWYDRTGKSWRAYQELGCKPKSKQDEAAWKADGSPTSWTYRTEGMKVSLSTEPGERSLRQDTGRPAFHWGNKRLTLQDLQALPTDAGALKERVVKDVKEWSDWAAKDAKTTSPGSKLDDWTSHQDYYVAGNLAQLMYEVPTSKQVRKAALQALKSTSGVRDLGRGTFALPTYTVKQTVLDQRVSVDPSTLTLRSWAIETKIGGRVFPAKTHLRTFAKVGWTDEQPAR